MQTNMQTNGSAPLQGKNIAVLMTDGVEQVEYTGPRQFLEEHGAQVTLISPKQAGESIQGFNHLTPADTFAVEMNVNDAQPTQFDALVLPGGVANPDQLRLSPEAIGFIRDFAQQNKPIAAICHGPWTLIDAGVAQGKRMTSWPSLKEDLSNAGAQWSDEPVVVDAGLVTSRKPDDIPAFDEALLAQLTRSGAANDQDSHGIPTTPDLTVAKDVREVPHNIQDNPGEQSGG